MASNSTQHYQLCQWEPGDKVERLDFNSDNEKIDAAIRAAADLAAEGKALAQAAYGPENSPFVIGTYKGNGAASQTINLGFTPRAVLVVKYNGFMSAMPSICQYFGGLAVTGHNASASEMGSTWNANYSIVAIVENGFRVALNESNYIYTNFKNEIYYYIALK